MTVTKRYLAEPTDVIAIRVVCTKCSGSVSIPPNESSNISERCPTCGSRYLPDNGLDYKLVLQLLRTLVALRDRSKAADCKVHFEFNLPE